MKKHLALIALLLVMVFTLAACGSSGSGGGEPSGSVAGSSGAAGADEVTLTFTTSVYVEEPHQVAIDKLVEAYKVIAPNVTIEIYGAGYADYWDNLTSEIMAGNEADIMQMYPSQIATYNALRAEGVFVPLDDSIAGKGYEEALVGQDECILDGQTLALSSYAYGTTGIFYRKSMLEAANINPADIQTWDDFVEASRKLSNGEQYAMGILTSSHTFVVSEWCRMLARPVSNGLYFPDGESGPYEADRINVNSPENVWAAKQWQNYLVTEKLGKDAPDKKDSREYFWNGICAFNHDGPWFIGMTEESYPELMEDIGLMPIPAVVYEGTTYKPNPTKYSLVAGISKNCENYEEALAFLEWMGSEDAAQYIQDCGMIPSNKAFSSSKEYASTHELAGVFNSFLDNNYTTLVADPAIPQLGELEKVMVDATQAMFAAGEDCQTALDQAATECKEIMER